MHGIALRCTAVLLLTVSPLLADVVHLKNGNTLEGEVALEGDTYVVKRGAAVMKIAKDKVARIERKTPLHTVYAQKLAALQPPTADGYCQIGEWCLSNGLQVEAGDCFRKAIGLDPDHEVGRRQLGHKKVEGKWHTRCEACKGKGTVRCETCLRKKNLQRPCPNPDCRRRLRCTQCQGRGSIVCRVCGGRGKVRCAACDGSGRIFDNVGGPGKPCAACRGTGRRDCRHCDNGRNRCRACDGNGFTIPRCPQCGGKGHITIVCPDCKGTHKVNCTRCNGAGTVPQS